MILYKFLSIAIVQLFITFTQTAVTIVYRPKSKLIYIFCLLPLNDSFFFFNTVYLNHFHPASVYVTTGYSPNFEYTLTFIISGMFFLHLFTRLLSIIAFFEPYQPIKVYCSLVSIPESLSIYFQSLFITLHFCYSSVFLTIQ